MKILILHHRIPFPLYSGMDKTRYNLIRTLSIKHQVTLIAPEFKNSNQDDVNHVKKICHRLVLVPVESNENRIMRSKLLKYYRLLRVLVLKEPQYIYDNKYQEIAYRLEKLIANGNYDFFQMTSNVTSWYMKFAKKVKPRILGPMDDSIESSRTKRLVSKSLKQKVLLTLGKRAQFYYDIKACKQSDWVFFHSENDLQRFNKYTGNILRASVLPLAVEASDDFGKGSSLDKKNIEQNSIIFVGGLGSIFNSDAVLYFYKKIFPIICNKIPEAQFYVVGQNPSQEILEIGKNERIIVTGKVTSIDPYIKKAAVYVAPVRSGTGFITKIVEALKFGKAIVATKLALQGLWDLGNDVIQIRDDPEDFAFAVVSLLKNPKLREDIFYRARRLYEQSYSFESVAPKTLKMYDELENYFHK